MMLKNSSEERNTYVICIAKNVNNKFRLLTVFDMINEFAILKNTSEIYLLIRENIYFLKICLHNFIF